MNEAADAAASDRQGRVWPVLVIVVIRPYPGDEHDLRTRAAQRVLGTLAGIALFALVDPTRF